MLSLGAVFAFAAAPPARGGVGLGSETGLPMQVILLLTGLTFLPAVLVSLTPFLRITLVLHFLRQALGTQTAPSNQVLLGLSLFLTTLLIQPVAQEAYAQGWRPLEEGTISRTEAWNAGGRPVKKHLLRFAREKDIALMLEITKSPAPRNSEDLSLAVLAPAYVLSELKAGFQIGAVLFLPFLVIDLVVASVTLSVGMVQLPPVMVSAPFKILLFVLVDGWNLVVGSLMKSFK
jgi:flagellar biosynthetic protein FliP